VFLSLVLPQQLYPSGDGGDPHPLFGFVHQLVLQDVEIGGSEGKGTDNRCCSVAVVLPELFGRQPLRLAVQVMDFAIQLPAGEPFVAGLVESDRIFRWLDQTVLAAATEDQRG